MSLTLAGKHIAILIANGFDENQMTEIQRALVKVKAVSKTVAPENGVVNGWQGASWGHYFPVNAFIGEALGSDFDALVIPGGERGIAKLKANPHARRIIGHFLDAEKPVAAIGAGLDLLAASGRMTGRTVSCAAEAQPALIAAGATVAEDPQTIDGALLTANGEDLTAWVTAAIDFFATGIEQVKEAA